MNIEEKSIRIHLISIDFIIFSKIKKKPFSDKVNRGDIIISFLSLRHSTYDSKLSTVEEKETQNVLKSSYMLYVISDVKAVFKEEGSVTTMFILFHLY